MKFILVKNVKLNKIQYYAELSTCNAHTLLRTSSLICNAVFAMLISTLTYRSESAVTITIFSEAVVGNGGVPADGAEGSAPAVIGD